MNRDLCHCLTLTLFKSKPNIYLVRAENPHISNLQPALFDIFAIKITLIVANKFSENQQIA